MKKSSLFFCFGVLLALGAAQALAQDPQAPINQMLDGFNSGDMKAVAASYSTSTAGISIIDEVPPFHWSGPKASETWAADLAKADKAAGLTEAKVEYDPASHTETSGDIAYVVVPTRYVFKQNGKPMSENARMTFVLHKESGAWKIASWVWSGDKAQPK